MNHSLTDWAAIRDEALSGFSLSALPRSLELPALPVAVSRFIEKANRPDADLKELAKIIETDSGLTVELLKHVNSAYIGLRSKASSVLQSLALLGLRQSRNLMIAVGTRAAVQARRSKLINQNLFWTSTLQRALFSREVAGMLKADRDAAFAGALLQDYLLPVLTNDLYSDYAEFVENRDKYAIGLCEFERQTFGWDHALAEASLASRWNLPDELVCCILFHNQGLAALANPKFARTSVAAVALSALLPDQLRQAYRGLELLHLLEQKWPAFRLADLALAVDHYVAEMGMGVRDGFPLAPRCQHVRQAEAVAAAT